MHKYVTFAVITGSYVGYLHTYVVTYVRTCVQM